MKDIRGRTELGGRFRALRRFVLWGLLGVAVLAAAVWAAQLWWHWMYPVVQFRYKLTVEVMTPEGLKSGSSVIEVRYSSGHPLPNPGRYYNDALVAGDAVYVDLGQGKNLFVLLGNYLSGRNAGGMNGDHGERYTAFGDENDRNSSTHGRHHTALSVLLLPKYTLGLRRAPGNENSIASALEGLRDASPSEVQDLRRLPTMVTFGDLRNMDSAKIIQSNDFSSVFGTGFSLHRATLQITSESTSSSIENVLPWLRPFRQYRWPNLRGGPSVINSLQYNSFKQP